MSVHHAPYLSSTFVTKKRTAAIKALVARLRRRGFDTIACRGLSGMVVAPTVAYLLDKQVLVVRKSVADNHSRSWVESSGEPRRYIIIDDFVFDGHTVKAIADRVAERYPAAKCAGVYCYDCQRDGGLSSRRRDAVAPLELYALRPNKRKTPQKETT